MTLCRIGEFDRALAAEDTASSFQLRSPDAPRRETYGCVTRPSQRDGEGTHRDDQCRARLAQTASNHGSPDSRSVKLGLGPVLLQDPSRANVRCRVPAFVHVRDLDDVAGVRSVDELSPADVDTHVAEGVEKD